MVPNFNLDYVFVGASEAELIFPTGMFATILADSSSFELLADSDFTIGVHFTKGFGITGEFSSKGLDDKVSD